MKEEQDIEENNDNENVVLEVSLLDDNDRYDVEEVGMLSEVIDLEKGDLEKVSLENLYQNPDEFMTQLSLELEKIKNDTVEDGYKEDGKIDNYYSCSPLSMSLCSSPQFSEVESERNTLNSKKKFKKLTYEDVERSLNKHYSKELSLSNELDILITYLKGQKHIFNLSKHVTNQKFDYLMFPALITTGSLTVLAPFMDSVGWSGWVVSVLNALLTILITVNNFMKLQAVAAMYNSISYQYDKLRISVEMTKTQFIYVENEKERQNLILDKMKDTEKRIMDIHVQYNHTDNTIPYEVRLMNPVISHINIFSFIKKIELHKRELIIKYKDTKNEIRFLMYKWENSNQIENKNEIKKQTELEKMQKLLRKKEDLQSELIQNSNNNVYSYIDNLFVREMQNSDKYYTYHSAGMYIFFRPKPYTRKDGNKVVDDYLEFVL